MRRFNFGSAIFASIVACIIMTAFMMYFKMNIMVHLGRIAGMTTTTSIYFVGGAIHLIVALVFGLIYALIFQPLMHKLPGFLSGAIYSLLPFILAMTLMGQFTNFIQTVFKVQKTCSPNPMMCNPCIPKEAKPSEVYQVGPSVPAKECSPMYDNDSDADRAYARPPTCSADYPEDCGPDNDAAENPIPPQCRPDRMSPSAKLEVRAPRARDFALVGQGDTMCHPKGNSTNGQMKPESNMKIQKAQPKEYKEVKKTSDPKLPVWLWSLINHVIFGFFLGLIYSPRKRRHISE